MKTSNPRRAIRRSIGGALALLPFMIAGASLAGDDDERGRQLFTQTAVPPCALCHVLSAAGASGDVGPSLDELKPDARRVFDAVKKGIGAMPAYKQTLSDDEITVLASYVARVSAGAQRSP